MIDELRVRLPSIDRDLGLLNLGTKFCPASFVRRGRTTAAVLQLKGYDADVDLTNRHTGSGETERNRKSTDACCMESKLKTALDEISTSDLTLMLFGFQFEAVFQDLFQFISPIGQAVHCASLMFLLLTIGGLIAPSMVHQMAYGGESRRGALSTATALAGASLLPLTIGLGLSAFAIFERMFGRTAGVVIGATFSAVALALLYGLGFWLRRGEGRMPPDERDTPLKTKVEQMLTEARVIIPGGRHSSAFSLSRRLPSLLPICLPSFNTSMPRPYAPSRYPFCC